MARKKAKSSITPYGTHYEIPMSEIYKAAESQATKIPYIQVYHISNPIALSSGHGKARWIASWRGTSQFAPTRQAAISYLRRSFAERGRPIPPGTPARTVTRMQE